MTLPRRRFLSRLALAAGGAHALLQPTGARALERRRAGELRVAAVVTEYRPWAHAGVICGRFIQGFALDVSPHPTPVKVRAMYVDQLPETDLSRALAKQYG